MLDYAVPGEKKLAKAQVRKLRPVLFDDLVQERLTEWDGCNGWDGGEAREGEDGPTRPPKPYNHKTRDECSAAGCSGADNIRKIEHHCDDYECGGTSERPCWLVEQHVDRPGLIAEEVMEVYPKAVWRDMTGKVEGIDYATIVVELLNVVQYLADENDEQETRLNSLEARLAALEAA